MLAVGQSRYDDSGGGQDAPNLHVGGFVGEHTRGAEGRRSQSSTDLLLVVSYENFLCILKKAPNNFNRYVDLTKAYSVILGKMYKTLYNISVRREAEEQEPTVKAVLEKCKRSDVQEDDSLLTRMEKDMLQGWRERRRKLSVLEMRVEETVFILRDLAVHGVEGT